MLKESAALGWLYLFSPAKGAAAARRKESLAPSLWLYAAFMAAYVVFFWLKPFDFPDKNAAFPREALDLGYWLKVILWQPPLELAWIAFLAGLVRWFREGSLPVRLAAAMAWWAALVVLMVAYGQLHGISQTLFAVGSLACFALFYPLMAKVPREEWRPLLAFMLGINVIGLVLFIPMEASALLDWPGFYYFLQILGGLWVLGVGTLGLRALTGLRLPRAFMAILLSLLFQTALPFILFLLGLVPKEILKALFYG